jgi:hypothetical protein
VGSATSAVAFQLGKDDQALGRGKLWVARGQDEFPGASPDHDVAGVGLNDPLSGHRVDEVSPLRLGDDPVSGLEPVEVPERCSVCRPVTGHDDPAVLPRPGLFEVGAKRFFEAAATRGVVARSLAEVFGTNPSATICDRSMAGIFSLKTGLPGPGRKLPGGPVPSLAREATVEKAGRRPNSCSSWFC